jgi:hypothetical protein
MFNIQCCGSGFGIRCLLDPWIQEPGWVLNIPDHISESFETSFGLKILKFFDADPGWKNSDTGSGINIPDPQHCQQQ